MLPGCTALHLSGDYAATAQLSLAGCPQLHAIRKLRVSEFESLSLNARALPALDSLAVEFNCGSVSLGAAPLPALRSLELNCKHFNLDPAVVPHLCSLKLGWQCDLTIPGTLPFTALTTLHFQCGQAALLAQLLQRAPRLVELALNLPSSNTPGAASEHMQVRLPRMRASVCRETSHCNESLVVCTSRRS